MAWVACLPLFFIHPFGFLVFLPGGGEAVLVEVAPLLFKSRFFCWNVAIGCSVRAYFIVIFFCGIGFLLGYFGLSPYIFLTLY